MQKKMTKPESMALLLLAVICLVVWAVVFGGVPAPLNTQSLVAVAQAANSSTTPQRQIDAGAKQQFDVISVKQNNAARTPQNTNSNVPLGPMDDFTPTFGLLVSNENSVEPIYRVCLQAYGTPASSHSIPTSEMGE